MIYLDTSALVTFVTRRPPADELDAYLVGLAAPTCTSTIGMVEAVRSCDRIGDFPGLMRELVRDHIEIPMSGYVRDAAARLVGRLKSMDAVHVASAEVLGSELTVLVTYDKRMADAARAVGLPVASPGA